MSEKSSESKIVSALGEAQSCVRTIAGAEPGDTVMRQLDRAARRISFWRWSRVKDAWYADKRMRVDADELAKLQELATKYGKKNYVAPNDGIPFDAEAFERRLRVLEAAVRLSDQDLYRALVDEGGASQD